MFLDRKRIGKENRDESLFSKYFPKGAWDCDFPGPLKTLFFKAKRPTISALLL